METLFVDEESTRWRLFIWPNSERLNKAKGVVRSRELALVTEAEMTAAMGKEWVTTSEE